MNSPPGSDPLPRLVLAVEEDPGDGTAWLSEVVERVARTAIEVNAAFLTEVAAGLLRAAADLAGRREESAETSR